MLLWVEAVRSDLHGLLSITLPCCKPFGYEAIAAIEKVPLDIRLGTV